VREQNTPLIAKELMEIDVSTSCFRLEIRGYIKLTICCVFFWDFMGLEYLLSQDEVEVVLLWWPGSGETREQQASCNC
jgi:hypothetical protein